MIKAIETAYNGYRFRSRLEARWAVFFDTLGIKYLYEPEGYDLGDGILYLPDFYLPQVNMFAEVKARELNGSETIKAVRLAIGLDVPVLMLIGLPKNYPYKAIEPWEEMDKQLPITSYYCLTMYHNYPNDESRFYAEPGDWTYPHGDAFHEDTEVAALAARQARFEHGENGS